jgi:hypothetical protein
MTYNHRDQDDGERYDHDGYKTLKSASVVGIIVFLVLMVAGAAFFFNDWNSRKRDWDSKEKDWGRGLVLVNDSNDSSGFDGSVVCFGLLFIFGVPFAIWASFQEAAHKRRVATEIAIEKEQRNTVLVDKLEEGRIIAQETIVRVEKAMEKLQSAVRMGDVIISGNYAPVTISDAVILSYNTVSDSDPELASVIKTLAGYVEESKNKAAAEYFNDLHREMICTPKKKATLKSLWNSLTLALPGVLELTEVAEKVKSLFS